MAKVCEIIVNGDYIGAKKTHTQRRPAREFASAERWRRCAPTRIKRPAFGSSKHALYTFGYGEVERVYVYPHGYIHMYMGIDR